MEKWRKVFREGLLPQLSRQDLEVLLKAVVEDDPALIQGDTVAAVPDAALPWTESPPGGACFIGYCGMKSEKCKRVIDVLRSFESVCLRIDNLMHCSPSSHHFTNWFDETPRDVMRGELRSELERALLEVQNV